ncbi:MAG TPA: hypothetical protein VFB34_05755 [Chloroflexota bacterium]|nr:hypothetical protein [Chloroflexota bacterium]
MLKKLGAALLLSLAVGGVIGGVSYAASAHGANTARASHSVKAVVVKPLAPAKRAPSTDPCHHTRSSTSSSSASAGATGGPLT